MNGAEQQGAKVEEQVSSEPVTDDDFVTGAYGEPTDDEPELPKLPKKKTSYAPWHHPVKQLVRSWQWADQTARLVAKMRSHTRRGVLRYFTLPGPDLMDVRVISDALVASGTVIEYFGFDSSQQPSESGADEYFRADAELRQAGKVTASATVFPDRLEDIAKQGSTAANRLDQERWFDVVNIDACDHLAFRPEGRDTSIFDALNKILAHQMSADEPWLLFLTTRADPALIGEPGDALRQAIADNLAQFADGFGQPLADCIDAKVEDVAAAVDACWKQSGIPLLKMLSVGLGKYLLQFYHQQANHPADVELVSAFAYHVHGPELDMLSLAFRIAPRGLSVQKPSAAARPAGPPLELAHAIAVAEKAKDIWAIDAELDSDPEVRKDALEGTLKLLDATNYDLDGYKDWLASHKARPMQIDLEAAEV